MRAVNRRTGSGVRLQLAFDRGVRAIVAAIQYALLTAPLPGWAKAGVVILGALAASSIVTALARVTLASKLVGG